MKNATITEEFVSLLEESGRMQGADPLLASIFAHLYAEPGDMSMEDLVSATGYSTASISSKAKILESLSLITRVRKPGTKRAYFRVEKDIISLVKRQFMKKEETHIRIIKEKLPVIIKRHEEMKMDAKGERVLGIMKDYYDQTLWFEKAVKEMIKKMEER